METALLLKTLLIVLGLVAIAFAGLAIKILIKKGGKFPEIHIGKNKNMKDKGITCATSTEKRDRIDYKAVEIEKRK